MKHVLEVGDIVAEFRLTASDIEELEGLYKKSVYDILSEFAIKTVIDLLRFMRKDKNIKLKKDAYEFYDYLVDNGFTVKDMTTKIIIPCAVASGLISESDVKSDDEAEKNA